MLCRLIRRLYRLPPTSNISARASEPRSKKPPQNLADFEVCNLAMIIDPKSTTKKGIKTTVVAQIVHADGKHSEDITSQSKNARTKKSCEGCKTLPSKIDDSTRCVESKEELIRSRELDK